jgi:hypothetical protein
VEEVEAEVEQAARDLGALDRHVLVVEVPAARAHEQRRELVLELVVLAVGGVVGDRAVDRVDQVHVADDDVLPRRRVESSKSAMKPLAPELSALMTSLRSVGPVISTRRSR